MSASPEREDHPAMSLPTGTVTFLFTDIEGSTALLQHLGDHGYAEVLHGQQHLLRDAFHAHGGREVDTQGDAFLVAFGDAEAAVAATLAAQRAIRARAWPEGVSVRVRMGLHTGEPLLAGTHYVGLDVHRAARIMAAGYGEQILVSQATHDHIGALPPGHALLDLDEHRLKDLTRPERIFQVVAPDLPADFPPLKTLDVVSNNLPIQLTAFIGREREVEDIKRLLARARLLTLMGSGGAGKTRLSVQVAADLLEQFPKGVWLVELAPVADPALVVQTVASTLGVREVAGRSLQETLIDYLQSKSLLLVLDNCEHLVAACAQMAATLLRRCSNLKILATSREALGIAGEATYRVPPLSRPDPRRVHTLDQLTQFESVNLFVERALQSQPRFALTETTAEAVAHICHRLDGIPLALELAAARVKLLTPGQIAARLDDRFRLLTGGARAGLPHHQTLRAAMDWSYDLLSDNERTLLRRLAVFAGGFDLEAVEQVCAGVHLDVPDILDLLSNLVDKSLVAAEGLNGESRYWLLETIRQYSFGKLQDSGDGAAVRARHLNWCLGLAEQAEPELQRPDQLDWLARLEREHDNLRAALDWAASGASDVEAGPRLAGALHRFWSMRGHLTEGRAWLEGAINAGTEDSPARTKAIYGAGVLAFDQGDYDRATVLFEQSLRASRARGVTVLTARSLNGLALVHRHRGDSSQAIVLLEESQALSRSLDDKWGLAQTLHSLALTVRRLGDYERATALLEESLPLWREAGDKWGLAKSFASLGVVARLQGDFARARSLHEESLALSRELEHKSQVAEALLSLGTVAQNQGDYARAAALHEECLAVSRESGDKLRIAAALLNLANVSHYQGDNERAKTLGEEAKALTIELGARQQLAVSLWTLGNVAFAQGDGHSAIARYRESLTLYQALGDKRGIAESLECLAGVGVAAQQGAVAARLLGAAEVVRERIRAPVPLSDRPAHERACAAVRDLLPEAALAAAWALGRQQPLEDAVREAMEVQWA